MSGAKVQFYFEVGEILGFFTIAGGDSKGNTYICGSDGGILRGVRFKRALL
jgi:hypothetical protein